MEHELITLLKMNLNDAAKSAFIAQLKEKPTKKRGERETYLKLPRSGLQLIADSDGEITAIHVSGVEDDDGYRVYQGSLPDRISFKSSRKAVRKALGKPTYFENGTVYDTWRDETWDLFDLKDHSSRFTYSDDELSIILLVLMRPEAVPR